MALKDVVAKDNQRVFMNLDDFAEEHTINGKAAVCIVQNVGANDYYGAARYSDGYYDGVSRAALAVNVCRSDLAALPLFGQLVNIDGKEYLVQSVADDMGIVTLTLEANER